MLALRPYLLIVNDNRISEHVYPVIFSNVPCEQLVQILFNTLSGSFTIPKSLQECSFGLIIIIILLYIVAVHCSLSPNPPPRTSDLSCRSSLSPIAEHPAEPRSTPTLPGFVTDPIDASRISLALVAVGPSPAWLAPALARLLTEPIDRVATLPAGGLLAKMALVTCVADAVVWLATVSVTAVG